jgi:hypothetical protein
MPRLIPTLMALVAPAATWAVEMTCEGGQIEVFAPDAALAERVCDVAETAARDLLQCHVKITEPLSISLVNSLPEHCVGLYHCNEGLIEVLVPEALDEVRTSDSAFAEVPTDTYFESVIVHEMTHSARDAVRCPFSSCVASDEYAAYAMQIRSLPPDARAAFEADLDMETPMSRDALSAIMLAFSPDRFAQRVWVHFNQRTDPCGFVQGILDGRIFLDREHL